MLAVHLWEYDDGCHNYNIGHSTGRTGRALEYVAVMRQPVLCTLVGTYVGINVPDHAYGVLGWAQYIGRLDQPQQSSVWEID